MSFRGKINKHFQQFMDFLVEDKREYSVLNQFLTMIVAGMMGYYMPRAFTYALVICVPLLYWGWLRDQ